MSLLLQTQDSRYVLFRCEGRAGESEEAGAED